MALEIERKFLTCNDSFRAMASKAVIIKQGYLSRDVDATVRVRIIGHEAFVTVKTRNAGYVRHEYEYPIPVGDASEMLQACKGLIIEKTRHIVPFGGFVWEVDEFDGALKGIVVAEIELPSADTQFTLPPFIGEEVTSRKEYYNSNIHLLAKKQP